MAMLGGVFCGTNGIDEAAEAGDGRSSLENPSCDVGLGAGDGVPARRGSEVFEAHDVECCDLSRCCETGR